MAKTDETAQQAAEFLRAWQEQMARQMTDPAAIHAMLSALSAFTPRGTTDDASPRRPAPASHADDDAIRDLTKRLRAVERELVELRQSLHAKNEKPTRARARPVAGAKQKTKRPVPKRMAAKKPKPKAKPKRGRR